MGKRGIWGFWGNHICGLLLLHILRSKCDTDAGGWRGRRQTADGIKSGKATGPLERCSRFCFNRGHCLEPEAKSFYLISSFEHAFAKRAR
jgi:hypothetical protein